MSQPVMDDKFEKRVRELRAQGLTHAQARREARAERADARAEARQRIEEQRLRNQVAQFSERNHQAKFRIGLSFFRFIRMLFK